MGSLTENKFPILLDYGYDRYAYVLPVHEFAVVCSIRLNQCDGCCRYPGLLKINGFAGAVDDDLRQ